MLNSIFCFSFSRLSLSWTALILCWAGVVNAAERPNVLLICVDDLRPELACYGKAYIQSPHIDSLARSGRAFHRHYVQAPTCGASRFTLLTGRYGSANNQALFNRADQIERKVDVTPSLPEWFRQHGYTTVSVGKVSHHPGGRGGGDWQDDSKLEMPDAWDRHLMPTGPWHHPRGAMHGLANGEIRSDASAMDVYQSVAGADEIYPDGLINDESLKQLTQLASESNSESKSKPFFLAVGVIRPHLPFGCPEKYFQPYRDAVLPEIPHPEKPTGQTTWHRSGEFMNYNHWDRDPNSDAEFATEVRKHYAACVTFADAQVGKILAKLDELGLRDNTIIVLWGDHGWHLGEHAVWGKHTLFEESLRSPLIVSYKNIPQPGQKSDSMVETLDLFPTLCELAKLPPPDFVDGVSLVPILESPTAKGHSAISYSGSARTIRTENFRLIAHQGGAVELYDHTKPAAESKNVARENGEVVARLSEQLNARLQP